MIELSPEQQHVVDFRDGHLQVIACASSGKTESISRRVARLIPNRAGSTWKKDAAAQLEQASDLVDRYARNDHHVGLPYDYLAETKRYEPEFVVGLHTNVHVLLEIKGYEIHQPDMINAKNSAGRKWPQHREQS